MKTQNLPIVLDHRSGIPIYLQIVEQVRRWVSNGDLHTGDQLPTVRQIATELRVNFNTVARAYLELEHEGVIYKRQGQGTYVSAGALEASRRERRKAVAAWLEKALEEAAGYGMAASEVEEICSQAMKRYKRDNS